MDQFTYLSNADPAALDELYRQYLQQPASVDESWVKFFEGIEFANKHYPLKPQTGGDAAVPESVTREFKVINLINGYRSRGHLFTRTNPVRERRTYTPSLDIENFGLEAADLQTVFHAGNLIGIGPAKLSDIVQHLKETYCQSIGAEYMYMRNQEALAWVQQKLESSKGRMKFSAEEKKVIFSKLNEAVGFESFLDKRFVGQKRFSLEGCEALIPSLDRIVECGADLGLREVVMGMAHRGRLNVLANIFHKDPRSIFTEFEGKEYDDVGEFSGDVKYHLGYSTTVKTRKGQEVKMTLAPNPSHLEAVGPVVTGISRAFAERNHQSDYDRIVPVILHGDAAISGQGVVYELIQMAKLDGYKTGGTIHIVVNNQVGFTTNYTDGRSSIYCTDVAKVTLCPVFHVNADDVEAVLFAVQTAVEFRQKFHGDVFIDLLGYRKYGHNEGDEPRFTQPILYKAISKHPNPRTIYLERLKTEGVITDEEAKELDKAFNAALSTALEDARKRDRTIIDNFLSEEWKHLRAAKPAELQSSLETGLSKKKLTEIGGKLFKIPKGLKFFNKMERLMENRSEMIRKGTIDWGVAELLAYGSLLTEGFPVRFSGQDVERGTFSHRHAVLKIEDSEEEYVPLNNLADNQAQIQIYNSLLSEYAVLGYDYGYSLAHPDSLTIWEAQFGDFFNGAQIVVDQFISSAEDKWRSMSGLVMFLPHGFEGQGAEHSSARIERFLSLAAENNMYVVNATTPANLFHLLRRQVKSPFRKPLVLFTPKSLLRHPRCISSLDELAKGRFQELIDDPAADPKKVKKLVFCSGKLYYDLLDKKEKSGDETVALIRIEQLYPFPEQAFDAVVAKYKKAEKKIWAQEEPENMGALGYILRIRRHDNFEFISRSASGSPATGSTKRHNAEQEELIRQVFSS